MSDSQFAVVELMGHRRFGDGDRVGLSDGHHARGRGRAAANRWAHPPARLVLHAGADRVCVLSLPRRRGVLRRPDRRGRRQHAGAGAGLTSAAQFTGTNIARQMDTGKSLAETSGAAAFGAAIPQALLDTAAMALMPGIGKLFGSVGEKLTVDHGARVASTGEVTIKEGDVISIDGTSGEVFLGEVPVTASAVTQYFEGELTAEQVAADPTSWTPDPADLHPSIVTSQVDVDKKEKTS